jgi:hypothetical protein
MSRCRIRSIHLRDARQVQGSEMKSPGGDRALSSLGLIPIVKYREGSLLRGPSRDRCGAPSKTRGGCASRVALTMTPSGLVHAAATPRNFLDREVSRRWRSCDDSGRVGTWPRSWGESNGGTDGPHPGGLVPDAPLTKGFGCGPVDRGELGIDRRSGSAAGKKSKKR